MTSERPSLPDRLHVPSWMRKAGWYVVGGVLACAGTWLWGFSQSAARSVVTESRLQAVLAVCDQDETTLAAKQGRAPSVVCRMLVVQQQLEQVSKLLADQTQRVTTADRERWQASVRVSNLQRDLVGVQVALDRALQQVTDARVRDAVYDAAASAKSKYETFVLQKPRDPQADPMTDAAERVLREARVPR